MGADEPLLGDLDHAANIARKTRSELFRLALQEWLDGQRRRQMVAEDRAGYEAHPVAGGASGGRAGGAGEREPAAAGAGVGPAVAGDDPDEFEGLIAAQAVEMQATTRLRRWGRLVRRGEIWMFRFAPPDKQRPVLLLTRSDMIPVLNSVTVAPLTRTIRGVPSEVVVGAASKLKQA